MLSKMALILNKSVAKTVFCKTFFVFLSFQETDISEQHVTTSGITNCKYKKLQQYTTQEYINSVISI